MGGHVGAAEEWSGSWTVRRANRLLSTGYRAQQPSTPSGEVIVRRPNSVALDALGLVFWAVCLFGLLLVAFRLPGGSQERASTGQTAVIVAVLVFGFVAVGRAWRALRAQLETGNLMYGDGREIARWSAEGRDVWRFSGADGRELARARRRSSWQLGNWYHGPRWSITVGADELRHSYGPVRGVFPQTVESAAFRLSVTTVLGGMRGWQVRFRRGTGDLEDPLIALGLGILLIELGRAAL